MRPEVAFAGVLLLGGLSSAQQPPTVPRYCYDTKCRGAFCLYGDSGEATYCLGPKGVPSSDEKESFASGASK
jgi:hypothetical protein